MKRFLPAFLGLSVLLTACPGAGTPELPVPTGASVLNGVWQGTLTEQSSSRGVTVSPDRVFELRTSGKLRVYRLEDGAILAERPVPAGAHDLAWRPDGTPLLGLGQSWQRLDPDTLTALEERALPARLLGFSVDGTVALEGPGPQRPRLADGFTVDLASRHGNPCRIQGGLAATRIEALSDGGLAVGYSDSVVELRAPDGALRRAVRLDTSCDPVQNLRRFGDVLAVAAWNGLAPDVTLHTLEGEVAAPAAPLRGDSQAALRLALPGGVVDFSYERPLRVALRGGGGWTVSLKTLLLRLDTRATYLNEQQYRFEGTASLGEERWALSGTAGAFRITLKPAASPPPAVHWQGTLKRTDGQTAGTLVGNHGAQGAGQSVFYQSGDITYRGELRRP